MSFPRRLSSRPLLRRLDELMARHEELWLRKSRPGGLADSRAHLQRVAEMLTSA